jgi:hypothetical protein
MDSLSITDIAPFLLVSLLWGVSNPFIEKYSKNDQKEFKPLDFSISSLISVFQRWRFLVAFAINSSGSVFFAYLLGIYP